MAFEPIGNLFWKENQYYREETSQSLVSRAFNFALTTANRLAFFESKYLARVPYSAAGVLFQARKPQRS